MAQGMVMLVKLAIYRIKLNCKIMDAFEEQESWGWVRMSDLVMAVSQYKAMAAMEIITTFGELNRGVGSIWYYVEGHEHFNECNRSVIDQFTDVNSTGLFVPAQWAKQVLEIVERGGIKLCLDFSKRLDDRLMVLTDNNCVCNIKEFLKRNVA